MKFRLYIAFVMIICGFSLPATAEFPALESLTIYTEHNPPFNFHEDGEVRGASVDILLEIFNRLNIPKTQRDLIISPWARGYNETQLRENTMLFSTVRTPTREFLFKWVGPINTSRMVLIARQDAVITLNTDLDVNKYRYGVAEKSRGEQILLEAGTSPDRLIHATSTAGAARMLARGRIDLWSRDLLVAFWTIQNQGLNVQDFKVVHAFQEYPHYFAFNKHTDNAVIKAMQQTLNEMKNDGTLETLNQQYLKVIPEMGK